MLKTVFIMIYFLELFDSTNEVLSLICAGLRLSDFSSIVSFVAYYLYAIPLAVVNGITLRWGI